ncbi:hypothetical protein QYE76_036753 [Lolium multiflorum]|uniref:Cytochrome P450 71D7 n=1 Tax=Lolium multiflorum TaxID=4521 RepID=A0AAD8R1G5_LOLMU|nr:hypothetical protein QYE76_036753 [Lolium multiflorum]
MEVSLSLCFAVISTVVALWFVKLTLSGGKAKKKHRLPPGPWTLPVIGSLHHMVSLLPHRAMMQLSRRHGPLMLLRLGEVPTVVVSSAKAAALVMRTNDLAFASRPHSVIADIFSCGYKNIAFAPYGDRWCEMRKVCVVELLSSNQVNRIEVIRAEEVGNLVRSMTDAALAGATINVSAKVVALSNDVVTRAVFGGKFAKQGEYLRELGEAFRLISGFCPADLFPSSPLVRWLSNGERDAKRSNDRIQRIISDVMEERKTKRASGVGGCSNEDEDLLDVLLKLQQEDSLNFPLTTEIIGAVLFDIFAGATETTGTILGWIMSELVRSPEIMAKAQQEVRDVLGENRATITNSSIAKLHYVQMVIKEAFRLHPPAVLIPRMAREDSTIMGYDIPKATNVFINVFAILRDPAYWTNPGEFKPERFENSNVTYNGTCFEFIPFGAGRRQCPGTQFSWSLTEMVLTNFLYHFDWMLPDGASLTSFDMSEKFGLAVSRRHDLKLRLTPHVWFKATPKK